MHKIEELLHYEDKGEMKIIKMNCCILLVRRYILVMINYVPKAIKMFFDTCFFSQFIRIPFF